METLSFIFHVVIAIAFYAAGFIVIIVIPLFLGWLCILIVLFTSASMSFSSGDYIEMAAAMAAIEYGLIIGVWVFVWSLNRRGDDLPPILKPVAWLWPHPAKGSVDRGTTRDAGKGINMSQMADEVGRQSGSRFEQTIRTHQSRKMAKNLQREEEWLRAEEELARRTVEVEKARARVQELRIKR